MLELDGLRDFGYRTTFFGTRSSRRSATHVEGRRRRLKARVRHYVDSGDCFFELKHRGPRDCIVKRRLTLDPALGDSLTPESVAALERWAQAAHGRSAPGPLEPVLEVDFTRATLVAPDRGERLTIVRQDLLPAHETLFPVPEYVGNWA